MDTITVNVQNKDVKEEILNFLKHYKADEVEFTTIEDLEDLKLLHTTRREKTIAFDEYLNNEH